MRRVADPAYDVVVLGTGAAGLVAALSARDQGASVGVFEKAERLGGTTAISGGIAWIPANPQAADAGVDDSVEDGIDYLRSLSNGMIDDELAAALVQTGPECWIVFDERCFRRYGFSVAQPDAGAPDWLERGSTLAALAQRIGVPGDALEQTITRFNHNVTERDPDFGRGDSAYDAFNGEITETGAPATLGVIDSPPYDAVRLESGALGTKGGPRTDADGRVLDLDGEPIPGLYAAGNAMAGPTGMVYGGAGGTIGPAMTFGFLAGRHAGRAHAATERASLEALHAR
jgi:predicted oxidoreductase